MSHMFKKYISLLEINLSNKKTKVSKMTQMFCESSNIKKLIYLILFINYMIVLICFRDVII